MKINERGSRNNDIPIAKSTLVYRSTKRKRNQGSLEKWLIPGIGQGRYKMSLDHLVREERKCSKKERDMSRDKAQKPDLRSSSWPKLEQFLS